MIAGMLLLCAVVGADKGEPGTPIEDWPVWRGPRGDGTSREQDLPLKWSATENIHWKTRIPGVGHSSI